MKCAKKAGGVATEEKGNTENGKESGGAMQYQSGLHAHAVHVPEHAGHRVLHSDESRDTALLAFDMLDEGTQRVEARTASGSAAQVRLLIVRLTPKVLVETRERLERAMTQAALVRPRVGVEGCLRRIVCDVLLVAVAASEHPPRVRDEVIRVVAVNEGVDHFAVDTRLASSAFHMQDERGM